MRDSSSPSERLVTSEWGGCTFPYICGCACVLYRERTTQDREDSAFRTPMRETQRRTLEQYVKHTAVRIPEKWKFKNATWSYESTKRTTKTKLLLLEHTQVRQPARTNPVWYVSSVEILNLTRLTKVYSNSYSICVRCTISRQRMYVQHTAFDIKIEKWPTNNQRLCSEQHSEGCHSWYVAVATTLYVVVFNTSWCIVYLTQIPGLLTWLQ